MLSRDAAVRSLIQSIYVALKQARPLTDADYDTLCDRQHQLGLVDGLVDPDLVAAIEADLLTRWPELIRVESQQGAMGIGRYLHGLTDRWSRQLNWMDDYAEGNCNGPTRRKRPIPSSQPPCATWLPTNWEDDDVAAAVWPDDDRNPDDSDHPTAVWAEADESVVAPNLSVGLFTGLLNSGFRLLLGVAIAYGLWQVGQPWLANLDFPQVAIAPSNGVETNGVETVVDPTDAPLVGSTTANNDLEIDAAVFSQLQRSLATAKGLHWDGLSPTEQGQITQELSQRLATVPIALRQALGTTNATDAKQRLQPPAGCQTSTQALYDQTDLGLYRLFPDLLGYNIAGTGFDQLWYGLLRQQMARQC